MEFAKVSTIVNDNKKEIADVTLNSDADPTKKKKKENLLKWGRPVFGIYDRYSNPNQNWAIAHRDMTIQ